MGDPGILTEVMYDRAVAKLSDRDQDFGGVIDRWGAPPFWVHQPGFPGLVLAILSQQVSLESAHAAFTRLGERISPVDPAAFLTLDDGTVMMAPSAP